MNRRQRLGIRGRLLLAFAVLSAFTLFASAIGWISYSRLAQELDTVVKGSLHALQLMAEIKERGVLITTTAPTLLAAKNQRAQQQISDTLAPNISAMMTLLPRAVALIPDYQITTELSDPFEQLKRIIESLVANVTQNLEVQHEKLMLNRRLRWAGSVFLSDIDGLSETMQRDIYSRFDQDPPELRSIVDEKLQAMYRIKADVNLLINLLDRAQYVPDLNSLVATNIYSAEVVLRIQTDLAVVDKLLDLDELNYTIFTIISLAKAPRNIFTIRRDERVIKQRGDDLLAQMYHQLERLNILLNSLAKQAQSSSESALKNAQLTIDKGRIWMVSMVAGSLLFSILIVWLYVGRNMVARITNLDAAMRSIANGNLAQQVLVKGGDEIGAMARSLEQFRNQLSTLQEELVQAGKLAALGQLSAGIAHEINQPLSAIRLYARNGERFIEAGRVGEAQENLQQISSVTKRAITIITRLKSLAKDERQSLVATQLSQVINSALAVLSDDERLNKDILSVSYSSADNLVSVDPIQLEQVIINLLTNALDSIAAKVDQKIDIQCLQTTDYIQVYVKDNGSGGTTKIQEKIFDPFFTTKTRGQSLGLGLSISYNIINSFGGKLGIVSSDASGTIFCVQLPKILHRESRVYL